jgi:hypothetical protein
MRPPPPKIGKKKKYHKNFRASLCPVQFFLSVKVSKSELLATWFGSKFHNLIVLEKNEYK